MEEWKDIKGYEGLYRVSDRGTVESVDHYARNNVNGGKRLVKGRQIAVYKMPNGYTQVTLSNGDKREKKYLHRIVADAFIPPCEGKHEVNHKDGNKLNNAVENLEWVKHKENQVHMVNNGLTKKCKPVENLKAGKKYRSILQAERETGIDRHHIEKMCRQGNGWRYVEQNKG